MEYEVLPHVTDVDKAMAKDAPVILPDCADHTVPEGMGPNVARMIEFGRGDLEAGYAEGVEATARKAAYSEWEKAVERSKGWAAPIK